MLHSKQNIIVNSLIWDDWNKEHIDKHDVTVEETEEACQGKHEVIETFRKRFLLKLKILRTRNILCYNCL